MKRFIESIIHWHSSCYITLTFLVYFFSTNGLEGTDTCVKTLVGIILGSIIIIIMEHNKIHTIINKNKKRIFLIFPVFILMEHLVGLELADYYFRHIWEKST